MRLYFFQKLIFIICIAPFLNLINAQNIPTNSTYEPYPDILDFLAFILIIFVLFAIFQLNKHVKRPYVYIIITLDIISLNVGTVFLPIFMVFCNDPHFNLPFTIIITLFTALLFICILLIIYNTFNESKNMSPLSKFIKFITFIIYIIEFINIMIFPIYLIVKAESLFHSNTLIFYIASSIYLGLFLLFELIIIKLPHHNLPHHLSHHPLPDKKYLFKLNFVALLFSNMVGITLLYSRNMYITKGFIALYLFIMTRCIDPNSFWTKGVTLDNDRISNNDSSLDINGARDYR
ncbi:hypothetical protein C2G38_920698 [Gigaspora rosea]|uniref:Frag1/DRAM/Sfk1 family-domain-containing protein n=1 Tax=Gigaspora rosea TaxID=44941 RepID=A0A397VPN5_9GLOM|nr:hypothetical protein C2G38_920698 [Gigaspora rosea]